MRDPGGVDTSVQETLDARPDLAWWEREPGGRRAHPLRPSLPCIAWPGRLACTTGNWNRSRLSSALFWGGGRPPVKQPDFTVGRAWTWRPLSISRLACLRPRISCSVVAIGWARRRRASAKSNQHGIAGASLVEYARPSALILAPSSHYSWRRGRRSISRS